MSSIKLQWILEFGRNARLFFRMEARLADAIAINDQLKADTEELAQLGPEARASSAERNTPALGGKRARQQQKALRDGKASEGRSKLPESYAVTAPSGIKPENVIWIFGSGRTGSTWLGNMMGDLENHSLWHEPYIGDVFGSAYYLRAWDRQRERESYILSRPYKRVWLQSMRAFLLDGARARYPNAGGYLVIKEPHGSIAAPLLMEALPESGMVFLVRDPRDVVASRLDAHKIGGWTRKLTGKAERRLADTDPDAFVKSAANAYLRDIEKVKEAYDAFNGRKVLVS